jgi:hypothetical protein
MHETTPFSSLPENRHIDPGFCHQSWRPPNRRNGDVMSYTMVREKPKTEKQRNEDRTQWWNHHLSESRATLQAYEDEEGRDLERFDRG